MTPPATLTSAAIQLADVVDSLALTEHGKRLASEDYDGTAAHRLASSVAFNSPAIRADETARVIRRYRSIVALLKTFPRDGKALIELQWQTARGTGSIATLTIPAHHLDTAKGNPRELARVVADLLR